MKAFFEAIGDFFVNVAFKPLDLLRYLELENWWAANIVNWLFTIIGTVAAIYWIMQLNLFNKRNEEDRDSTSHSFL